MIAEKYGWSPSILSALTAPEVYFWWPISCDYLLRHIEPLVTDDECERSRLALVAMMAEGPVTL